VSAGQREFEPLPLVGPDANDAEVLKAVAVFTKLLSGFCFVFFLAASYFQSSLRERPFASQMGQNTHDTVFRLPWFFIRILYPHLFFVLLRERSERKGRVLPKRNSGSATRVRHRLFSH